MRKIDEYVIDYICEDVCLKVANVEVGKEMFAGGGGGGGRALPSAHKNTYVYRLIASGEGTSNYSLRSPKAYSLTRQ